MVALGYLEGKSCVDEVCPLSCAVRRDVSGLRCVDIKTGCAVGLALRQSDARMEAVDFDGDGLGLVDMGSDSFRDKTKMRVFSPSSCVLPAESLAAVRLAGSGKMPWEDKQKSPIGGLF